VAVASANPAEPGTFSLESLPDHTVCRVLFAPPFYRVWVEPGTSPANLRGMRYERLAAC